MIPSAINSLNSSLKSNRLELIYLGCHLSHSLNLYILFLASNLFYSIRFHVIPYYSHVYKHIWSELWHSFRSMHSLLMQQTVYANEAWVRKTTFQRSDNINVTLYLILFWRTNTHICECNAYDSNRGDNSRVRLFMSHVLTKSTKKKKKLSNFLSNANVVFQRNESVKGHADLKYQFLSLFQNLNETFRSIELEWNFWNISFKIKPTQCTQGNIEFNANDAKIQISIYGNRCQLPINGNLTDWTS